MKSRVLFLDDCPNRQKVFRSNFPSAKIVSTAQEAIAALESGEYDIACLDHDLGGEVYCDSVRPDTGMEVVRWLCANNTTVREVIVHTLNPGAGDEMVGKLALAARFKIHRVPFLYFKEEGVYEGILNDCSGRVSS